MHTLLSESNKRWKSQKGPGFLKLQPGRRGMGFSGSLMSSKPAPMSSLKKLNVGPFSSELEKGSVRKKQTMSLHKKQSNTSNQLSQDSDLPNLAFQNKSAGSNSKPQKVPTNGSGKSRKMSNLIAQKDEQNKRYSGPASTNLY